MKISFVLAMAFAVSPGSVRAQSFNPHENAVIVTATRTAQTADESLAAVTVITREDIERRQSQDIVDLLRTQAGIDIVRSGGPGGDIALFMRGTNRNHVLVLIDGLRVASMTTGAFDWRSLPLAHIERIEIVRGPRASLYGSEAIGGVVQIFTRRPSGPEAAVEAGRDDTRRADVAWGSGGGRVRTFVTASHFETEGFSAQNERGASFDPDNDGARHQSVSAGIDAAFTAGTRLDVIGRQNRGFMEFDRGIMDIYNAGLSTRLSHRTTSSWSQSLSLGAFNEELETRSSSYVQTKRHSIDWQNDVSLGTNALLTAGFAYFKESGINRNLETGATEIDQSQDNRAMFAIGQYRFGDNDVQLAGRYDDYSRVGGHGTWSTAYGRALSPDIRVWASYGTAFRAPTLNDLFHPGFGGFFAGNPNLEPERSRTAEIGIRQRWRPGHTTTFSLFSTRVEHLITFDGPNFQAINVDRASMRGVEIEHHYNAQYWHLSATATLQRARNDTTGTRLARRADNKFSALIERRFNRGAAGVEIVAVSDRLDSTFTNIEVAGYGIVNLAGRYRLRKSLSLEGRLENLLDKQYQEIEGFNTPGRSLFVTLRYRP